MTEDKLIESEATKPGWVNLKSADVEKLIIDLGKQGNPPEKIGLILRDSHGIPKSKLFGKKIRTVLINAGVNVESDLIRVKAAIAKVEKHIKSHKHDNTAKRSLTKKLWLVTEK